MKTLKDYLEGNLDPLKQKIIKKNIRNSYDRINLAIKLLDAEDYEKAREIMATVAADIADIEIEVNAAMAKQTE